MLFLATTFQSISTNTPQQMRLFIFLASEWTTHTHTLKTGILIYLFISINIQSAEWSSVPSANQCIIVQNSPENVVRSFDSQITHF